MQELKEIEKISNPIEKLLVADSLTGQDAVNIAKSFNEELNITGIILTRIDGVNLAGVSMILELKKE